jgi:hypothetical protein
MHMPFAMKISLAVEAFVAVTGATRINPHVLLVTDSIESAPQVLLEHNSSTQGFSKVVQKEWVESLQTQVESQQEQLSEAQDISRSQMRLCFATQKECLVACNKQRPCKVNPHFGKYCFFALSQAEIMAVSNNVKRWRAATTKVSTKKRSFWPFGSHKKLYE